MDKLDTGIGVKEGVALEALPVKVLSVSIEMQRDKQGKEVGEKAVFVCQHPKNAESIKISTIKYEKANKIEVSGAWFKPDASDNNSIPKRSALAALMRFANAKTVREIVGKELPTSLDEKNYLTFRAY